MIVYVSTKNATHGTVSKYYRNMKILSILDTGLISPLRMSPLLLERKKDQIQRCAIGQRWIALNKHVLLRFLVAGVVDCSYVEIPEEDLEDLINLV